MQRENICFDPCKFQFQSIIRSPCSSIPRRSISWLFVMILILAKYFPNLSVILTLLIDPRNTDKLDNDPVFRKRYLCVLTRNKSICLPVIVTNIFYVIIITDIRVLFIWKKFLEIFAKIMNQFSIDTLYKETISIGITISQK